MSSKRRLTGAPVSPAHMAHIVLRTPDKNALLDWYGKVLGADLVYEDNLLVFITFGNEHHRLAVVQMKSPLESTAGISTVDPFAYPMGSLEDLLNPYLRLQAEGIMPT